MSKSILPLILVRFFRPKSLSILSEVLGDFEQPFFGAFKCCPRDMVTQGANVRKCVLLLSTLFLTIQFLTLIATAIFYIYANSDAYRNTLEKFVFTRIYNRSDWLWLRQSNALSVITNDQQIIPVKLWWLMFLHFLFPKLSFTCWSQWWFKCYSCFHLFSWSLEPPREWGSYCYHGSLFMVCCRWELETVFFCLRQVIFSKMCNVLFLDLFVGRYVLECDSFAGRNEVVQPGFCRRWGVYCVSLVVFCDPYVCCVFQPRRGRGFRCSLL